MLVAELKEVIDQFEDDSEIFVEVWEGGRRVHYWIGDEDIHEERIEGVAIVVIKPPELNAR